MAAQGQWFGETFESLGDLARERMLRDVAARWDQLARRRKGAPPSVSDLFGESAPELMDNLSLLGVVQGGQDFVYRKHGSVAAELVRYNRTGQLLSAAPQVPGQEGVLPLRYQTVLRAARPLYSRTSAQPSVPVEFTTRLVLPLAEAGRAVDMIAILRQSGPRRLILQREGAAPADAAPLAAGELLEGLDSAAYLVAPDGRLLHMNARARGLTAARYGLGVEAGEALGAPGVDGDKLRAALRRAANEAATGLRSEISLALRGPGGGVLLLRIAPVFAARDSGDFALLVLAKSPMERTRINPARLEELFGLTPAEARLAARLGAGTQLKEAANSSGTSYETVRRQLRAVFAKTGTARQSELVRLIQMALGDA